MATLQIMGLSKQFDQHTAVRDLSLDVHDKEFVVLLGPSGCGKTTTLRMVAGLEEPSRGHIYIDQNEVTFLPPRKRNISMVFQNYAVWPHMTVFDNIAFALRLRKESDATIIQSVQEVARLTRIEAYLERLPGQLSGGQQQRVALARALAVKPKLFLMDEPFSNLDAALRVEMRTETKAIHRQVGSTSIFVTHDQAEAMSMADRIVVMKDGEIVQTGTPDDVYHQCSNIFVAGFIGIPGMNFFQAPLQLNKNTPQLKTPDFSLPIPENVDIKGLSDITLGIRPEDIHLVVEKKALFSSTAMVVEPQGSHQIVSINVQGSIVKIVTDPHPIVQQGETVHLDFNRSNLHFFDPKTTHRLTST